MEAKKTQEWYEKPWDQMGGMERVVFMWFIVPAYIVGGLLGIAGLCGMLYGAALLLRGAIRWLLH